MLEIVKQENISTTKYRGQAQAQSWLVITSLKNEGAWSSSQTCAHFFHTHWSIVIKKWICFHRYDCMVSISPFLVHFVFIFILIHSSTLSHFHLLSCSQEGSQHCTAFYRFKLTYEVVSSLQLFEFVVCANKLWNYNLKGTKDMLH